MAYSFGHTAPAHPRSAASRGEQLADLSLGPAKPGALDKTPFGDLSGINAGPDWRNAFSAWVRRHAYYPDQAAELGQDGDSTVYVKATPNGKVTSVELEQKSGSPWLDMALVSMFRDAHLPPLPPDDKEPLEFHFTMHYILMR
jgi:TonB family protein